MVRGRDHQDRMILYVHGFGSCGDSTKTRLLKSYFGEAHVLSPDLPVEPDAAIEFLTGLIEENEITLLVGSSLGGYYATFLAKRYALEAVLINPSVKPYETLEHCLGINRFWCSGEPFEWKAAYLDQLRRYDTDDLRDMPALMVLLQTGDEVLDYKEAAQKYRDFDVTVEEGGNHRFENLADYLEKIESFLHQKGSA
jgi:predicted esterase YcpF (UPF0227 family)